jgi:lipooligosaccharide transport system permease protein
MSAATKLETRPSPPAPGLMWDRALAYWLTSYRRVWRGSLFSGFLSPVFFLVAMGFGLGALVDAGDGIAGVGYVAFIAPGVLAAQAMQTAVIESTYPVLGAVKWQRQYHAMLAAPLGTYDIVLGHLAFILMRVVITSATFLLVAWVLGAIGSSWAVLALPVAALCGMAHAGPVFAFAVRQEVDSGFAMLFRFVILPMFLFSGTFFPVDQLPSWLEPVAWVTPLWHAVDLCRSLALGTATPAAASGHVAYLLLWVVVGLWLAVRSFRRRLVV